MHTPSTDLSPRELQILTRIVNGMTNAEIAEDLFISLNTIKTHIRSAYIAIGVRTRVEAVIWGVRVGLLNDVRHRVD